ncbi:MAG: PfkB family carbohydrate kinase, partial [SAR324 cluster bacterium]|nr:PfkB family carbohydrate kinase [SAR324 cluster bacterium]
MSSALLVAGAANLDRMMTMERIPEPGETMMALKYEEHPGGKGGNQAAAAAIWGQTVYFIGRVGRDEPGEILRNALEKAGVNTNFLIESSSSSGIALDFIDLEGTYQAAVYAGANAGLSAADVPADESLWESLELTVIQLECPLTFNEAIGQKSREYGVPVLLNAAPAFDFPKSWWDWIDVLVVNELEAESYAGVKIHDLEDARSSIGILQEKCRKTVITLGDKGLLAANGLIIEHIPAHSVEVV